MKQLLLLLSVLVLFGQKTYAQGEVVSYELLNTYSKASIDSLIDDFGVPGGIISAAYDVDLYRVLYKTPYRTPNNLVTVSGAVVVPKNTECDVPLTVYFHGTSARRTAVPSYGTSEQRLGIMFASLGNIVALPDYLGMGDSDTSVIINPYIHRESQANTGVNMIRAARNFTQDTLGVTDNGQLFLFGYSQGGFVTVATLKMIEDFYQNEMPVTAAAPMSGPYDLKDAQVDLILSSSSYPTPGYLPYIILGYQSVYGTLYDSIQQVLKAPYDSIIPPLFYGKTTSIGQINNRLPNVPNQIIQDSLLNAFANDTSHILRQLLAESHLLDWAPQTPVNLIGCQGDDQVTFQNSINAYDHWLANGSDSSNLQLNDLGNYTHGGCIQFAMLTGLTYFMGLKQGCSTGIDQVEDGFGFSLYPNPGRGTFHIELPGAGLADVKVFDMLGQVVYHDMVEATTVDMDLHQLNAGAYLVRVQRGEESAVKRLIIR